MPIKILCLAAIMGIISIGGMKAAVSQTLYLNTVQSFHQNKVNITPVYYHDRYYRHHYPFRFREEDIIIDDALLYPESPHHWYADDYSQRAHHCRQHPYKGECERFCDLNPRVCFP
jgi:hypothetical protein